IKGIDNQFLIDLQITGDAQSFDDVVKFPDITVPGIFFLSGHGALGYGNTFAQFGAVLPNELPHKMGNVAFPISQGWHVKAQDVEALK
ncbi:MAG: hypothetical protein WBG37_12330, partial [Desulfobacterales bacterium]